MTIEFLAWANAQLLKAKHINGHGITQSMVDRQVEKMKGNVGTSSATDHPPDCLYHLWQWFNIWVELQDVQFLSLGWQVRDIKSDVEALTGIVLRHWELIILVKLLAMWREVQQETTGAH
jgi:hypothetical protein